MQSVTCVIHFTERVMSVSLSFLVFLMLVIGCVTPCITVISFFISYHLFSNNKEILSNVFLGGAATQLEENNTGTSGAAFDKNATTVTYCNI